MATKTLFHDSKGEIPCRLYTNAVCGGEPLSKTTRILEAKITCTGTFSRPKPVIKLPTTLSWTHSLTNGSLRWDTAACHGKPLRPVGSAIGTLHYCASSWVSGGIRPSSKPVAESMRVKALAKQSTRFASVAETVFESRSTASMVAKAARRVAQIALYLRRGRWRSLEEQFSIDVPSIVTRLKPTRRLADGWLELEFGWKPLVQTAYDAVDAYQNRLDRGKFVKASSGSPFISLDIETHAMNVYLGKLAARATHCGYVSSSGAATLNSLGFSNPALIVWNLLPYSFVVDWFANVGDVLAALTGNAGLSNTRMVLTHEQGTVQRPSNAYRDMISGYSGQSWREVSTDTTPLEFQWKPGSVTNWRIVTAVALLRRRFNGS